jgi:aromatic ring-opening dioxygenase catalytic subunit (LigB family)
MDDPSQTWVGMAAFLATLRTQLPEPPSAILIVSGHWETRGKFAFTGSTRPSLIYDYGGFPPHTYQLRYDVPGDPSLAARAAGLLMAAGFETEIDPHRGLDHGVFVPLKVAFPEAEIPVVEMSLDRSLDPTVHLNAGQALAPLREEGVLIIGAGMSFHNLRGYGNDLFTNPSLDFNRWLVHAATSDQTERAKMLTHWDQAPFARVAHPRHEHLLPLMVASAATDQRGKAVYSEMVMKTALSGFRFD